VRPISFPPLDIRSSRISDVAVIVAIAAMISLIILPVPLYLLDVLIAMNIVLGVTLLLVSIYISAPTDFPVFPSVLLLGTVYRLALSIATTRLILTTGHAGRIIDVFGHVAAGGNLIVGAVIFVVITLVQFIVISKGAERVGEVAARFSLDAMPGKQMSIDSDLRAGLTDKDEARRRRRLLELESKLYGSFDGAMKFVRGDAVAGIFIVVVNLIGGLAVGVLQQGMPLADAVQTYSVLTIGDGMVTQLPALLFALAAGLVVTRSTAEGGEDHLGESLRQQLAARPRVPLMAGFLCFGLALVPGFPTWTFVTLGIAGVGVGILLEPALRDMVLRTPLGRLAPRAPRDASRGAIDPVAATTNAPLHLEISLELAEGMPVDVLEGIMRHASGDIERRLGLVLPRFTYAVETGRDMAGWRLWIGGYLAARGNAPTGDADALASALSGSLRRNLASFISLQDCTNMLQRVGVSHPEVAKEVVRVLSPIRVAEILRYLVEEETPLRDLHLILESLADAGQREKEAHALTIVARQAVHRQLIAPYAPDNRLRALVLTAPLEAQLRGHARSATGPVQLGLEPLVARALIAQIGERAAAASATAVVAPQDLRRPLRKLIEPELFDLPVLAYSELRSPLELEIVDRILPVMAAGAEVAA